MAKMETATQTAFPEEVRAKSAHVLAMFLVLQGLAALGGLAWLVVYEGAGLAEIVPLYFALVALLSLLAAALEWTRQRQAEALATTAIILSFGLTLTAVLAGLWYLVPFIGLTTIAAIFGLVDRFAVRDESRHQPKH